MWKIFDWSGTKCLFRLFFSLWFFLLICLYQIMIWLVSFRLVGGWGCLWTQWKIAMFMWGVVGDCCCCWGWVVMLLSVMATIKFWLMASSRTIWTYPLHCSKTLSPFGWQKIAMSTSWILVLALSSC